jgi:hypothetical protein
VSKETYYSVKRDLLQCLPLSDITVIPAHVAVLCQKRPITVSKETYYSVKRDLLQCLPLSDITVIPAHVAVL